MGIDIETYRGRIGTFKHAFGQDVVTVICVINFSRGLKCIGAVLFINLLLLIAGIESNPGPSNSLSYLLFVALFIVGIGLLYKGATWSELSTFVLCIPVAITLYFLTAREEPGTNINGTEGVQDNEQIQQDTSDSQLQETDTTSSEENRSTQDEDDSYDQQQDNSEQQKIVLPKVVMEDIPKAVYGAEKSQKTVACHTIRIDIFSGNGANSMKEWDISVLAAVFKILYKENISIDETNAVEDIRNIRNECAHSPNSSLDFKRYDSHRTLLEKAVETLAGQLDIATQNKLKEIVKKCKIECITTDALIGLVKSDRDEMTKLLGKSRCYILLQGIENAVTKTLAGATKKSVDLKRNIVVTVELKLTLNADERNAYYVKECEGIIIKEIETGDDKTTSDKLKKAANGIRRDISSIPGTQFEGCDSGSVFLHLKVSSYQAILDVFQYVNGNSMQSKLNVIADELTKQWHFQHPLVLSALVSNGTLLWLYKYIGPDGLDERDTDSASLFETEETIYRRSGDEVRTWAVSADTKNLQNDKGDENGKTCHPTEEASADGGKISSYTSTVRRNIDNSSDDAIAEISVTDEEYTASQDPGQFFKETLSRLNLEEKISKKITVKEVISVNVFENEKRQITLADLPWRLLKELISANCEARDQTVIDVQSPMTAEQTFDFETKMSKILQASNASSLSALDIFIIVFQCCDETLKILLVQKLFLCKLAIPFIYYDYDRLENVLSLMPLRSLTVESCQSTGTFEMELLDLPSKVVAFTRFRRPKFSKSNLLNRLLSSEQCNTFFNKESMSGTYPRHLNKDFVEMFCLPKLSEKDGFNDAMIFLNLRGDIGWYSQNVFDSISTLTDTIVLVVDLKYINTHRSEVETKIKNFSKVLLVIPNSKNEIVKNRDTLLSFKQKIEENTDVEIGVDFTSNKNMFEVAKSVTTFINQHTRIPQTKTFEKRVETITNIYIDENNETCRKARVIADRIFQRMENAVISDASWKSTITPVHSKFSPEIGVLIKEMHRASDEDETNRLETEIRQIRLKQLDNITDTVKYFLEEVVKHHTSSIVLRSILYWLNIFIDRKKLKIIPPLLSKNRLAWEKLNELDSKDAQFPADSKEKYSLILETEVAIKEASFGLESLFREIGHIYDAFEVLSMAPKDKKLPPFEQVATLMADLFTDGHSLEIIDGDSFYMPRTWIQNIMQKASNKIGERKVLALSALGLQSSGKSTLLNTMFGLQLKTSSGRCTRGINVQLVGVNPSAPGEKDIPFAYVLVIDTEGLRAPKLTTDGHDHDNELATVITGLGDETIINVFGENTSEINEVLQVVVNALFRLKLANKSLDLRKSCVFIHQNVPDVLASDKLKPGLRITTSSLDRATQESAKFYGVHGITTFDTLIAFDTNKHVFYLPNLWQGNTPMETVNLQYTKQVIDIKCKLIDRASSMMNKSYKTLLDLVNHASDLWKGILTDDFVFSFRNSLEIRTYVNLEDTLQTQLSEFETNVYERFLEISQTKFCQCENETSLQSVKDSVVTEVEKILNDEKSMHEEKMNDYFKTNEERQTTEQWKKSTMRRIEYFCFDLFQQIKLEADNHKEKRRIDILIIEKQTKHEERLYGTSLQLAKELKGQQLETSSLDERFNSVWDSLMSEADCYPRSQSFYQDKSMRQIFISNLHIILSHFGPMLKQELDKCNMLLLSEQLEKMSGSFDSLCVTEEDITVVQAKSFHEIFSEKQVSKIGLIRDEIERLLNFVDETNMEMDTHEGILKSHDVKTYLKRINQRLKKINEDKVKTFTLQKSFDIKFLVYVSSHAHYRFEKHNALYHEQKSNEVRLARYKEQMQKLFHAYIKDRKGEETAALSLSLTIENVVRDIVGKRLPSKVKSILSNHFPKLKCYFITTVIEDLVQKDDFELFVQYNHTPKLYSAEWLKAESEHYLFNTESRQFSKAASAEVSKLLEDIKSSVQSSVKEISAKGTVSFTNWINCFRQKLRYCTISLNESYRAKTDLSDKNITHFQDIFLENLYILEKKLKQEFQSQGPDTIEWYSSSFNPCDKLMEAIWGCDAQCPFCGEPCAHTKHDKNVSHSCIQHKVRCCTGVRKVGSQVARITSCNYDVHSKSTYRCDYLKYICNPASKQPCKERNHKYRDYKKYFKEWDIEPTPNSEERSKFWMWFVHKYRKQLSSKYEMDTSKIPANWGNISQIAAINSLKATYSRK